MLVFLDAFGWRFFSATPTATRSCAGSSRDGTVAKLTTQFPSTTAAHVTTLHTGRPVIEHGMYEWNIYEPSVDALITPLMFSFAGDGERDTLRGRRRSAGHVSRPATLYRRLATGGVRCVACHPASFAPSTYDGVLARRRALHPYETLTGPSRRSPPNCAPATRRSTRTCTSTPSTRPAISSGRRRRRSTPRRPDASTRSRPRLAGSRPGTLVLLAADHGQVDVDPGADAVRQRAVARASARICGATPAAGRSPRPGSARDLFLHTAPGSQRHVIDRLRALLGADAEVHATADLVAEGPVRRRSRPAPARPGSATSASSRAEGETVWWRERGRFGMRFRGHHGGLTPEEAHTLVASLVVA